MPTPEDYAANKQETEQQTGPTGPRTEEGKKRSSQNATRHGLAGRVVVLPSEDLAEFTRFSKGIIVSLHPETEEELAWAQLIADGHWRLKRARTWEDSLVALGHYEGEGDFDAEHEAIHAAFTGAKTFRAHEKSFVNLTLYEGRIHRGIERAKKALKELQTERKARLEAELPTVLRLHAFNKMLDAHPETEERDQDGQLIPTRVHQRAELVVHEFVYSTREIAIEARRSDARDQAKRAERCSFNYAEFQKMAA